jgi:hypothetical protein
MSFRAGRLRAGMTPRIREKPLAAGATGLRGSLLLVDANGAYAVCGADPVAIAAVAENDFGPDTGGYGGHGTKEFPPGYMQGTMVADNQPFFAGYVGTLPAADGASYGVVLDADGKWKVDFTDTTATRVKLIGRRTNSPENIPEVEVVFLAANVQVFG